MAKMQLPNARLPKWYLNDLYILVLIGPELP